MNCDKIHFLKFRMRVAGNAGLFQIERVRIDEHSDQVDYSLPINCSGHLLYGLYEYGIQKMQI